MIKIALVRGKYLNNFECQNFNLDKKRFKIVGVASMRPTHKVFPFETVELPSLSDLEFFGRGIKIVANRILGDSQNLLGLENLAEKFDIFHTADPHYFYSYQLARLRAKNKINRLVATSWETIPFNNESVWKKKKIKEFTKKYTDLFVCYTEKAKRALREEGVSERKIEVVRLGVDIDKFKIPNPKSQKNKITILFVGRLVEEKGVLVLCDTFKMIMDHKSWIKEKINRHLRLKIIGGGKLKKQLEKMIVNNGLSDLATIEAKNYDEMPAVYQSADIFVLPSKITKTWEEQYGMVLLEAMASGLPIVAYDSGAISELISDVGILVNEGNKNDLAKNILKLAQDRNLRQRLGRMGRKLVEKEFASKKTATNFEKIYSKLHI